MWNPRLQGPPQFVWVGEHRCLKEQGEDRACGQINPGGFPGCRLPHGVT